MVPLAGAAFWSVFAVLLGGVTRRRPTTHAAVVFVLAFIAKLALTKALLWWFGYHFVEMAG